MFQTRQPAAVTGGQIKSKGVMPLSMYHIFCDLRNAKTGDDLMEIIATAYSKWHGGLFCSDERDLIIYYALDKFNQIKQEETK